MRHRLLIIAPFFLFGAAPVHAGMTFYDLNDVVRLRVQDISFFALLLVICAFGIKLMWNQFAKGFPQLPRITFLRSACLTGVLSLLMLLVLSMISGARELLTPGAWRKQGSAYRLNDAGSETLRRQSMEFLRSSLWTYAKDHDGKFPAHDFVSEISEKIWQAPDSVGTRYIYVGSLKLGASNAVVAFEPEKFGESRFALFANGEIKALTLTDLRKAMGTKESE
jgi:hypothetical protein